MKRKRNKKMFNNLIFFVILMVITLWVLLRGQNISQLFDVIKEVKIPYILIGIMCMLIYVMLEAVNMGRTLKILGEKSQFIKNLKYACIGIFFSAITPAASGGQPMQVYYMHKEKISVANSTLALLINLTSMQIVTISFALISLCFNYMYLNTTLIICFIIGILLNLTALALLIIGVFFKGLSRSLVNLAIKILKIFKIKNIARKQRRMEKELLKYQESANFLKKNKTTMVKVLLTTAVQFFLNYSIAYCVYLALGFSGHGLLEIVSMQSVLFATVSGIPSPGSVGVSEGAFIEIFRNVYPTEMINSATILNRGINFYLFVLISGIVVIVNGIRLNNRRKE